METVSLPEKMTLPVILDLFEQMDQGLIDLSTDDMTALGEKARAKIDGYKAILDRCDTEIEHFDRLIAPLAAKKSSLQSKKNSIETMLLYFMKQGKVDHLSGEIYTLNLKTIKQSRTESVNNTAPDAKLYLKYSDFISRKYSWKLSDIKRNLKSKNPDSGLAKMFKLTDTVKAKFKPKSEV